MKRNYKILLEVQGVEGLRVSEILQCVLDRLRNLGSIPMEPEKIRVTNIPSYSSVMSIKQE